MTFASKSISKEENIPETDFKMTFAKSNKETTTNNTGSGLFMNVANITSKKSECSSGGLFMNVTQHKRNERIKDPKILRYEYTGKTTNVDNDNPNIIRIIRF